MVDEARRLRATRDLFIVHHHLSFACSPWVRRLEPASCNRQTSRKRPRNGAKATRESFRQKANRFLHCSLALGLGRAMCAARKVSKLATKIYFCLGPGGSPVRSSDSPHQLACSDRCATSEDDDEDEERRRREEEQ